MKQVEEVVITIKYIDENNKIWYDTRNYMNTQDAQSFLQINKCYNKEVRHQ